MTLIQTFEYIHYKMISIRLMNENDSDLCYELDSNTISLWSKNQWANEFKKEGIKSFGLLLSNLIIGICVFHVVLDEAQINFFVVNHKYRKKGFGTFLMRYLIKECKKLNINKLSLEVSQTNVTAEKFYNSSESLCEEALEITQELLHADASIQQWFDRALDFDADGDLGLTPVAMPRVVTSRSLDRQATDSRLISKREVKIATVEWAISALLAV